MSITFDKRMVKQCYDSYIDYIKDLESKKQQALSFGNAAGYQIAKMIDKQIEERKEELEGIKYALYNMT